MKQKLYIFDLDHTLIGADSNQLWNQFLLNNRIIQGGEFIQQEQQMCTDYDNGRMDINRYIHLIIQPLSQLSIQEIDTLAWQCIDRHILPVLYPAAKALINQIQQQQQPLIIISATVGFLVHKIAARLGIDHSIGVELHVQHQHYLPEIAGTPSYQQGKVTRLQQWLAEHPQLNGESHFYTDSINDLPLCQYADQVYLVNPCARLVEYNKQTGWPVLCWQ